MSGRSRVENGLCEWTFWNHCDSRDPATHPFICENLIVIPLCYDYIRHKAWQCHHVMCLSTIKPEATMSWVTRPENATISSFFLTKPDNATISCVYRT